MSPGPIPWSKIIQMGDYHGLDRISMEVFHHAIREMEAGQIKWFNEKKDKS